MSTSVRVVGCLVGLVAVFGAAFGLGAVADPDTEPVASHDVHGGPGGHAVEAATQVRLALSQRELDPGTAVPVSFQLRAPDGTPVTSYDVRHEKELHLIVLGTRDLSDFQHVHPARATDGTWTADLRLAPGTSYRLYADGSTGGKDFVATADVFTTGTSPRPLGVPEPSTTDQVGGYTVALDQHEGVAALRVTLAGEPVALERYLGALGHLVVIREDDLDYLHVHPEEGSTPVFAVAGLAPGRYRYFFDFQAAGDVHTAAFTVDIEKGAGDGHGH